jgi:hypothetical protein
MQSELLQKIEHDAARGKPCPKDLKPPETMLYYMLAGLYARYQSGKLTTEQGKQHKQQIMGAYKRYRDEYLQFTTICKQYQAQIRAGYAQNQH